jgi:haloalkane dehalogenase
MISVLPAEIAELFPFPDHWAEVGGFRLHFVDEGPRSDQAVVLLHGNPTWSFLYREIIPLVAAAGFRVIAPDHLGCGRSDHGAVESHYDIAHHTGRLLGLLDAAGVSQAVFFLQDWGAVIGMAAGAARGGLFGGAVVGNAFWGRGSTYHHRVWPWRSLHAPVAGPLLFGRRPVFVDGAAHGMPPNRSEAVRAAYRMPWEASRGPGATLAWPRAIALDDSSPTAPLADQLWEWMATADVPIRWVWGGSDVVFPPEEQYQAMADRFPQGRRYRPVMVEEGRHFIQEWAPQQCAEALVRVAEETFTAARSDDAATGSERGAEGAPAAPERAGLVRPLTVLVDEVSDSATATALESLGTAWSAPSGRRYELRRAGPRLEAALVLDPERIVAPPRGEEIDGDLLALAGAIADSRGGDWSSEGLRSVARVWGGWQPDAVPSPPFPSKP